MTISLPVQMRLPHVQARESFRPSVYTLISLRDRAQRLNDPLASLASLVCNILKAYKNSCGLVKSLIEIVYEYGVEKIEWNAQMDATEIHVLNDIETSVIPDQWNQIESNDFAVQVDGYKTYFMQRRISSRHSVNDPLHTSFLFSKIFSLSKASSESYMYSRDYRSIS
ncbi:hypothetical protein F5051DRAFT_406593 [Lentinula edodes]|nr:hypothetical protein F5051DRAFT_406593 [Lentinula edodes]